MTVYTKSAADVFAPTDANGAARGGDMGEAQVWGTEIEAAIADAAAGTGVAVAAEAELRAAADADLQTQVDGVRDLTELGFQDKANVRFRSTSTGALATAFENGTTHDDVVAATNDRFVMDGRTDPEENGIYVVQASGAPVRATDADSAAEIGRARVFVREGTASGGTTYFIEEEAADITLGTTELTWLPGQTLETNGVVYNGTDNAIETDEFAIRQTDDGYGMVMEDAAGNTVDLTGGVEFNAADQSIETADFIVQVYESDATAILVSDEAGNVIVIGGEEDAVGDDAFTEEEYAAVEARCAAKVAELNAIDISTLASYLPGANLFYWTGQSFPAGSDNARLWASTSYIALMGWTFNAWSIGTDYRTSGSGATYTTFGDTALHPLVENFISGSSVVSANDVATGNYTTSARGGTPGPLFARILAELRRLWLGLTEDSATHYQVHMNTAKTGASMAEIGTGDELARTLDGIGKFKTYVEAQTGSAEPSLSGGEDLNLAAKMHMQGQANDGLADDWETQVQDYDEDIDDEAEAEWGQTDRATMFLFQTGNANYGSALMTQAKAAVAMMLDTDPGSQNFNKTVACEMWDYANPGKLTNDHPNAGDWHPLTSGNGKFAAQAAVAAFYHLIRREFWFPAFPYEVFTKGRRFLIGVPTKFAPIREIATMDGHVSALPAHRGISLLNGSARATLVGSPAVVPGYKYLIEGLIEEQAADYPTVKLGERVSLTDATYRGTVNFADSFALSMALEFPFAASQTVYAGSYADHPATNNIGRFLEDVPGFVGRNVDLGYRVLRNELTSTPITTIM